MRVTDPAGPLQSDNAVTVGGEGAGWKQANEPSLRKRGLKQEKQSSTTGLLEKGQGASHRDRAEVNAFRQKDGGLIMTDHSKSK